MKIAWSIIFWSKISYDDYIYIYITSALYHRNNAWFKKKLLLSNCYTLSSLPFLYHDHFWTPFNPKCNRVIRNMAERVSGKNRMEDDFTRKNKSEIRNKMFLQKTLYFLSSRLIVKFASVTINICDAKSNDVSLIFLGRVVNYDSSIS